MGVKIRFSKEQLKKLNNKEQKQKEREQAVVSLKNKRSCLGFALRIIRSKLWTFELRVFRFELIRCTCIFIWIPFANMSTGSLRLIVGRCSVSN